MRAHLYLAIAAMLAASAPPAAAQDSEDDLPASIEAAVARVIADVMPTERRPRARDWGDFARRNGPDMVWITPPPNDSAPAPADCVYSRTGSLTLRGASAELTACGGVQRIDAVSVKIAGLWLGPREVVDALSAHGVTATPLAAAQLIPPPGSDTRRADAHYRSLLSRYPVSRKWRVQRLDEAPATLTAEWRCTPPGARSATRCFMTWTLAFDSDDAGPS